MRMRMRSNRLNKDIFIDKKLALYVEQVIQAEIEFSVRKHSTETIKRERQYKLSIMYSNLFCDKKLSFFEYSQIDGMLKGCSQKESLRVLNMVIYLLKRGVIYDDKMIRLLSFEKRFTTQGNLYADFKYLMNSKIYEKFIQGSENMSSTYGDKLFFSTCEYIRLHDDEIRNITDEWCEQIKLDNTRTISTRYAILSMVHTMAQKLFSDRGIDDLKRKDVINISQHQLLFEFLGVVNKAHLMSDDIQYFLSFKEAIVGTGAKKYKELCLTDNVFQFIWVRTKRNYGRIFKLDIPTGTSLFADMCEFASQVTYRSEPFTKFVENFYESMGCYAVTDTVELSMKSYIESSKYYHALDKTKYNSFLYSFYNYCYQKYNINFFDDAGIDIAIIEKHGLAKRINDGYELIKYNPHDNVPLGDRWILCYIPEYDAGTEHSPTKSIVIDFSDIMNDTFREWVKTYVWKADKSLRSKRLVANIVKKALNYIHMIRTRQIAVIYCREIEPIDAPITQGEATAIRQFYLSQNSSYVTKHTAIFNFKAFLHFLEDYSITTVPRMVYYHLYHHDEKNNTSEAIPNDELTLLTKVFSNHSVNSIQEDLYAVIYSIALDTHFRISTIVSLRDDCVVETNKKGEYVIVARVKDATIDESQEAITKETKRMIDHALTITSELRKIAPEYIKHYLFLAPQKGTVPVRVINRNNFTIYTKKCCREAGIKEYTSENLRDTHMTLAKAFQIKNHLSDIELSLLTGHKTPDVDMEHYVDMDIATMMEALHGIIIGNVNIQGKIVKQVPTNVAKQENEVSNGCGYCQSECCNILTYIDCLLCHDFVTMPSRLHFFEEQIKMMDVKIRSATTPHDKEDYINIKRLLVAYVIAIKEIEVSSK